MALTELHKTNISLLDIDTIVEILHECEERAGLYSVDEYHNLTKMNKRTIYEHISIQKLHSITFCGRKLIITNE